MIIIIICLLHFTQFLVFVCFVFCLGFALFLKKKKKKKGVDWRVKENISFLRIKTRFRLASSGWRKEQRVIHLSWMQTAGNYSTHDILFNRQSTQNSCPQRRA